MLYINSGSDNNKYCSFSCNSTLVTYQWFKIKNGIVGWDIILDNKYLVVFTLFLAYSCEIRDLLNQFYNTGHKILKGGDSTRPQAKLGRVEYVFNLIYEVVYIDKVFIL